MEQRTRQNSHLKHNKKMLINIELFNQKSLLRNHPRTTHRLLSDRGKWWNLITKNGKNIYLSRKKSQDKPERVTKTSGWTTSKWKWEICRTTKKIIWPKIGDSIWIYQNPKDGTILLNFKKTEYNRWSIFKLGLMITKRI